MPEKPFFNPGDPQRDRSFIGHYTASPIAADDDYIMLSTAQPAAGETTVLTFENQPDVPRCVSVDGNQATCTGDLVVSGTNVWDDPIEETLAINGTTIVHGAKAFKTITKITIPTQGAAGDEVFVGVNDVLGLHQLRDVDLELAAYLNGSLEGTSPTVTVSGTNIEDNTFDLNSALDGNEVEYFYIVP